MIRPRKAYHGSSYGRKTEVKEDSIDLIGDCSSSARFSKQIDAGDQFDNNFGVRLESRALFGQAMLLHMFRSRQSCAPPENFVFDHGEPEGPSVGRDGSTEGWLIFKRAEALETKVSFEKQRYC